MEHDGKAQRPLVKFGFTRYEARVYVSLISIRGSAHDIQELTGIPRGRVYDVLEGQVQKGYAGVTKGTPTLYSATDVQETFTRLKMDYTRVCNSLASDVIRIEQKVTAKTLTSCTPNGHWKTRFDPFSTATATKWWCCAQIPRPRKNTSQTLRRWPDGCSSTSSL
ncbi:MAG: hypothetical protein MJ014_03865 [Methanocorpusculum sp.]|nr:hypothetical protein [Methanocorpusculum sp.]